MSVEIQKQIKDNATGVSDYFQDLYNWTAERGKEETRRGLRRGAAQPQPPKKAAPDVETVVEEESIKRDKLPMAQYYGSWERFDAEQQLEALEKQAEKEQRKEREERQAAKDRILDEMALQPDGDRRRTSAARPRVKVSVRRSGRKAAPVDLALPRKEEANRLFQEGRFREAVASYTLGLDLLEKYLPPDEAGAVVDEEDGTGRETEAIALKAALLANRALALLKLEEWREVVVDCTEALRYDSAHHKARLRRGFAHARLRQWASAVRDLEVAVSNDGKDAKARAELQMAKRMLGEQVKEARAHARQLLKDPTRQPTMPTRALRVRVMEASEGLGVAGEGLARPPEAVLPSPEVVTPQAPLAPVEQKAPEAPVKAVELLDLNECD